MKRTSGDTPPQKIRIAGFLKRSNVNGPGIRSVIWVQGCPIRCEGCFNKNLWDYNGGTLTDTDNLYTEIIATDGIDGVTFSGGEPFMQARALAELGMRLHARNLTVVTFTGYSYEQIVQSPDDAFRLLMNETDLLISGPFISGLEKDHPLSGSSNQEVHVLTHRIARELSEPDAHCSVTEFTISPTGSLSITGFPERDLLRKLYRAGGVRGG